MMITSTANWMSDPAIQAKQIGQLVFPGTHDSGTFSLSLELSQMKYANIAFLWDLKSGQAPKGFPGKSPYYLGPELYTFVFELVKETAQAHDKNIQQQLNDGIRYFDLRLYWDTDENDLYIHHGLRGAKVSQLLQALGEFISEPGGRELVLLEVSHTNFAEQTAGAAALVAQLEQYVGTPNLYLPDSLDALAVSTLSSITGQGSRVIVLNTTADQYPSGSPVFSTTGFQDSGRSASGVDEVSILAQEEASGLAQQRTSPFYKIAWTLTTQITDIVNGAVARVEGAQTPPILEGLAKQANAALPNFIAENKKYSFNLIAVDWYEDSRVVDIAIELSRASVALS